VRKPRAARQFWGAVGTEVGVSLSFGTCSFPAALSTRSAAAAARIQHSPTSLKRPRQLAPRSRASGGDRKSPLQQKPPGRCDRTGRQKGSCNALKKYTRPRRITSFFLHAQFLCRRKQTEPAQGLV